MTYTLTTSHNLDGWDIEADWSFTVDPGYPATRLTPPEGPSVDDLSLDAMRIEGKAVEPPAWLEGWLRPTPDTLIAHANECLQSMREDQAEHQRDMRMEAAE